MPEDLRQYREVHQYLGPGCLCPLIEQMGNRPIFTEAAIYIAKVEPYKGEYVAGCAKSHCGYLGKSPFSHFLSRVRAHTFQSSTTREDVYEDWGSVEGLLPARLGYEILDATSTHLL
jgi:hypothetical protein